MEIIARGAPIVIGVLVLKYDHKIPSREMMWHRGAAWCAANRDACVLRKQRKQEYLKMNAPEVDDAASAKA